MNAQLLVHELWAGVKHLGTEAEAALHHLVEEIKEHVEGHHHAELDIASKHVVTAFPAVDTAPVAPIVTTTSPTVTPVPVTTPSDPAKDAITTDAAITPKS